MLSIRLARFTKLRVMAWLLVGLICGAGLTVFFYGLNVSLALLLIFLALALLAAWSTFGLYRLARLFDQAQHEIARTNRALAENIDERAAALQVANINLKMEVIERRAMETELFRYREHLEEIVAQRTEMLEQANRHLLEEIAQRKKAERNLFEQKERAQVTLASIGDAVVSTDSQGRVVYLNPVAETLFGWPNATAMGRPIADMMHLLNETTREPVENPVLSCLRENTDAGSSNASLLVREDGKEILIADSAAPIRDHERNVIGAVMVCHDVTSERKLAQLLSYQATHDALTGLVNRQEFENRLSRVLQSAQEESTTHALMFLDLDHFKQVNDTGGHAAGDELLRQVAALFRHAIRQRDSLARLGGDEFGLLLERCTMQQAESIAQELLNEVNTFTLDWAGVPLKVGLSIGMVAINRDSVSLSTVLSAADDACYASKHAGRNRYSIYAEPSH